MKRTFEVTLEVTVNVEIDDDATSDAYPGETILTAAANPERFIEGSTLKTVIGNLAQNLGLDNRRMGSVDGWADFDESAASAHEAYVEIDNVWETTDGMYGSMS